MIDVKSRDLVFFGLLGTGNVPRMFSCCNMDSVTIVIRYIYIGWVGRLEFRSPSLYSGFRSIGIVSLYDGGAVSGSVA